MNSQETIQALARRMAKLRRGNLAIALGTPGLLVVLSVLVLEWKFFHPVLSWVFFVFSICLFIFAVLKTWALFAAPSLLDAAGELDLRVGAKERFVTVASLGEKVTLSDWEVAAGKELTRQSDLLLEARLIETEFPFHLFRSAKISAAAFPLVLAGLVFAFVFRPEVALSRSQILGAEKADEIREFVADSPELPVEAKQALESVAEALEQQGLLAPEVLELLEETVRDMDSLDQAPPVDEPENATPPEITPPREHDADEERQEEQKQPEETPPDSPEKQQELKEEKDKTPQEEQQKEETEKQKGGEGDSSEQKESSQPQKEGKEKKQQGTKEGEEKQPSKAPGEQGSKEEEKQEQGSEKGTEPQQEKEEGDKQAGDQGKKEEGQEQGEGAGDGQGEKQGEGQGKDGAGKSGKQEAQSGAGGSEGTPQSGQSGSEGKEQEGGKESSNAQGSQGAGAQNKLSEAKEQLEKIQQEIQNEQSGKEGESGGKEEKAGGKEEQEQQEGSNGGASGGEQKDKPEGAGDKNGANDAADNGEKSGGKGENSRTPEKPGNKEQKPDSSVQGKPEKDSTQTSSSAGGTPEDSNKEGKQQYSEDDTAERFGPDSGDEAGLLGDGTQKVTDVEVRADENIVVRNIGTEDSRRFEHSSDAKPREAFGSADFQKPIAETSRTKQPIPVEYEGILR